MSGSQLGAAISTHCRRDEETGNMILINLEKEASGWRRTDTFGTLQSPEEAKNLQYLSLGGNLVQGFFVTALGLIMCL